MGSNTLSPQKDRVRLPIQADSAGGVQAQASVSLPPTLPVGFEGATEKLLQVGDLAQASGKTVRAIHLYEELGLLRPHTRSKGRYRLYDPHAVTRVRWIGKLHDLGMSLAQIREVVSEWEGSPSPGSAMSKVRRMYAEKLDETREQIARLAGLEAELARSIDYLDTCERCDTTDPALVLGDVSEVGSLDAPSFGAPLNHAACSSAAERIPGESATRECATCAMRERERGHEPELVAGIHHYPFTPKAPPPEPSRRRRTGT